MRAGVIRRKKLLSDPRSSGVWEVMFIYVECVHVRNAFCSVNREQTFVYAGKTSRGWKIDAISLSESHES